MSRDKAFLFILLVIIGLSLLIPGCCGPIVRVRNISSQGHGVIVGKNEVLTVEHLVYPIGGPLWVVMNGKHYPAFVKELFPRTGSWEQHVLLSVDLPLWGYEIAELDEIRRGDSGTPIFARGKVIGLISARDDKGNPIITRVKE